MSFPLRFGWLFSFLSKWVIAERFSKQIKSPSFFTQKKNNPKTNANFSYFLYISLFNIESKNMQLNLMVCEITNREKGLRGLYRFESFRVLRFLVCGDVHGSCFFMRHAWVVFWLVSSLVNVGERWFRLVKGLLWLECCCI